MKLNEASVLVTGSAGFIGSHLTEYLIKAGANVKAFVRYNSGGYVGNLEYLKPFPDNLEIIYGDLKNQDAVKEAMKDVDTVFNLASLVSIPYSYVNPREYFDNNIYFILNILQSAKVLGTKSVVHISTSEVYGTAETVPISEDHPLKGQSPYSASKIGADMVANSFYRSYDSPVVTVRPFNTYGPRQSLRAVIPTIIAQALNRKTVLLGDVRPTRDFNYVTDTVDGIVAAAIKASEVFGEVINLGTGVEVTIEQVAKEIIELTNSDAKIVFDAGKVRPSKSEVHRLCADASKAKKMLGWTSKISLKDGLADTIEWYKATQVAPQDTQSYV
ncbi:MAG: SDR family NAD(P)-dependent oxidoreductase [Candidatus Thorarchaeota archaeon]